MKKAKVKLTTTASIVSVFSIIITMYLYLPLVVGMMTILTQGGDITKPAELSIQSFTGLIVLAAALGGSLLWFVERYQKKELETDSFVRSATFAGKLFLYSALLLSLSMVLSPLLPLIKDATDWYYVSIKYTMVSTFLAGSIFFIIANIMGLIYAWKL